MKTTLNAIREHEPCLEGWKKLLRYLDKTTADDEPLSLITVLNSNGFDDALWCLRAVDGHEKEIRLYAIWCVRQVQHLMTDQRSIDALDVAEKFACGGATQEELAAAAEAADDAANTAWNSAKAAWDAANADAARATARAAAWSAAASDAVYAATRTANNAVYAATRSADAAVRAEQENKFREMFGE